MKRTRPSIALLTIVLIFAGSVATYLFARWLILASSGFDIVGLCDRGEGSNIVTSVIMYRRAHQCVSFYETLLFIALLFSPIVFAILPAYVLHRTTKKEPALFSTAFMRFFPAVCIVVLAVSGIIALPGMQLDTSIRQVLAFVMVVAATSLFTIGWTVMWRHRKK